MENHPFREDKRGTGGSLIHFYSLRLISTFLSGTSATVLLPLSSRSIWDVRHKFPVLSGLGCHSLSHPSDTLGRLDFCRLSLAIQKTQDL